VSAAERIALALGNTRKSGSGWLCRCPADQHKKTPRPLSIRDGDLDIVVKCFAGCSSIDVLRALRKRGLLDDRPRDHQPQPIKATDRGKLDYLLSKLLPIEGTVVATYLGTRGLDLPLDDHHLRYLPAKPPKYPWPCMVGIITDFLDVSRVLSLHFTRLAPDGQAKAPLPKDEQRSFLAGFPIKGGIIRLCDDADVTLRVGLGEGIETSLSITTTYRRDEGRFEPVWAASSATNMAALAVPDSIETLVVYADRGQAGEAAADTLAQRWLEAGREVFIAIAPLDDWNEAVTP
jgi:hypothetical protein